MGGRGLKRSMVVAPMLAAVLALPSLAHAAPPLDRTCTTQDSVRFCQGSVANRVHSFDGVPLDVDVTLPPTAGPFPTIVMLHGYGGSKKDFEAKPGQGPDGDGNRTYHWNNVYYAQQGYAVVNYTARGFGDSCGSTSSRLVDPPGCAKGWIHLADQRYEAHDTQFLLGKLVDEGISSAGALGVTGISYGGGQSIELAYLRDRIRNPDDSYSPWTSPGGRPLSITAAYPRWPWSDLVNSLEPNGRFLDYNTPGEFDSRQPKLGVEKQSYVAGLFALGASTGYYAPPGADPQADLTTWNARVAAGEPENQQARDIANEIFAHHQGFGLPGTPAPLLIQNGWTDDLFPPSEALRVYNSLRALNAGAPVSLQFGDLGHARGANKQNTDRDFQDRGASFFDAYLKGSGAPPAPGSVRAYTQTCPQGAAAGGPFGAASWTDIHPGAVRFASAAARTVSSSGGNQATGNAIDPISGGGDACRQLAAEHAAGTATYNGPVSEGFTLLGLPTVAAHIDTSGQFGQLDSRLWDVGPDGKQTLISRGAYRLEDNQKGDIRFQLHGNGWRFEPGHTPKLELVGRDSPYLRASNGNFSVAVSNVTVELPTLEPPNGRQIVAPLLGLGKNPPRTSNRIKLTVKPRRARAGRRTRFRFTATILELGKRVPVKRARVRFGRRSRHTDKRGHATMTKRFKHRGRQRAVARKRGLVTGRATARVLRARHSHHR